MKLNEVKNNEKKIKPSPLYMLERKLNLKSLIIFMIVSVILIFGTTAMFLLIETVIEELKIMVGSVPELQPLLDLLMQESSIGGYFAIEVGALWIMLGTIYAAYLVNKLVASNLKDGSFELLYTQNLSRTEIIKHKQIRLFLNITLFNIACFVTGLIGLAIFGWGSFLFVNYLAYFALMYLSILAVAYVLFGLQLILKKDLNLLLSIIFVIVVYFVSTFVASGGNFEFLNYLVPFGFNFADMINVGFSNVNVVGICVWVVAAIVLQFVGIIKFKKSDLI